MQNTVMPTKLVRKFEKVLLESETKTDEWIDVDEARILISRGKVIKKKTMSDYVSAGRFPSDCYRRAANGKLWFNKRKLMGL